MATVNDAKVFRFYRETDFSTIQRVSNMRDYLDHSFKSGKESIRWLVGNQYTGQQSFFLSELTAAIDGLDYPKLEKIIADNGNKNLFNIDQKLLDDFLNYLKTLMNFILSAYNFYAPKEQNFDRMELVSPTDKRVTETPEKLVKFPLFDKALYFVK